MVEEFFRSRQEESGIPLLTEIIPDNDAAGASSAEMCPPVLSLVTDSGELVSNLNLESESHFDSSLKLDNPYAINPETLARNLTQNLTQRLQLILDSTLDDRLHETMRAVIEQNFSTLRLELERALAQTAQEVVSSAVQQELGKITFLPK